MSSMQLPFNSGPCLYAKQETTLETGSRYRATVCVLRSAIGLRPHTYIAMGRCESDNICLGRGEDRGIRLERIEVACFIPIS